MKVLIISVKIGYGHHAVANSIIDNLSKKGVTCEMLDAFEYINPYLADTIENSFLFSTKYFREVYAKAYDKMEKHDERWDKYSLFTVLSNLVSNKLKDYITEFAPDIIIGTHSYAGMMMTYLREKNIVSCPMMGVVTDFTIHPFWESTDLDYYVVPTDLLEYKAKRKGIAPEKILPFGMPIREEFANKIPKEKAREMLGIENKMTVLIMMGSLGCGNFVKHIRAIDELEYDFQILCVCGKNEKMTEEVRCRTWSKTVKVYGFVDNVDVMMDASDLIITKPGGITSSEFLAKGLPAIIMHPIPGHEDRNTEFLVNNGAAIMVTNRFSLEEALYQMLKSPVRMEHLRKSVEYLGKPNATKDVCDFIMNLVKEKTDGR